MERNLLKEELKEIQMPAAMQARILENCRNAELKKENADMKKMDIESKMSDNNYVVGREETERRAQKKNHTSSARKWSRIATVAAAVTLCLGLGGVTAMAAGGKLEGFFADVTRWDGAVVGTTYEQATEEIEVSAVVNGDRLIVEAVLLKANEAPYAFIDSLGVQVYSVEDEDGNVVEKGDSLVTGIMTDGKVLVELPLDELESGSYKLVITEFTGEAKAEQPLPIKGYWMCEFVK